MRSIDELLSVVEHKNTNKGTTTYKFKRDVYDLLMKHDFHGYILELGTNHGDTTAILADVAKNKGKEVVTVDNNIHNIKSAENKLRKLGYSNCIFKEYDIYSNECWKNIFTNAGCVFIDCVHTEEAFGKDIENCKNILNENHVIIAHDYGLDNGGVKSFLLKNSDKYKIVGFLGEHYDWNPIGTSTVSDWEGVQVEIIW